MVAPKDDTAIVEASAQDELPDPTPGELQRRIRQQEILAELGVTALQGAALDQLLSDAARLTAEGLRSEFCKVLEYIPAESRLLVRAGVGWGPDVVGVASVGADLSSPAGFALLTGKPVISNHLENEERFRTPELLQRHNIRRAMNVILQGDGKPFGVLEVDSRSDFDFEEHDLAFLQGAANILGMAIERERREQSLQTSLQRQQFLLKEVNHRVKNSLAIVAGMLNMQAREVGDDGVRLHLEEASSRVTAVARAHDQLYRGSDLERLDVGLYIEALCKDLNESISQCEITTEIQTGIEISTDRAISAALVVNELITNSVKYGYQDRSDGKIWVQVWGRDRDVAISVRDQGIGLPANFDFLSAKGLGMRIVSLFTQQMNGTVEVHPQTPGTEFRIIIPVQSPA